MEIKQILDTLNQYYKAKPYLTLAGDDSGTPSLNKTENCAYFGILKSLTPEQLQEATKIIAEGDYDPIMSFFIQAVMHPQPKAGPSDMFSGNLVMDGLEMGEYLADKYKLITV